MPTASNRRIRDDAQGLTPNRDLSPSRFGRKVSRWWFGQVVYGAAVRLRGESAVFDALRSLDRSQWWDPQQIAQAQQAALSGLLKWAGGQVTRYEAFRSRLASVTSDDSLNVLKELPFLTKADLQQRPEGLQARGFRGPVTVKTTGGSTGQAVTVRKDRRGLGHEMAASWRGYSWVGVRPGDRGIRWWGRGHSRSRRLRAALADTVMNRRTFSAFAFTAEDLSRYWDICLKARPDFFYGYVSMLEAFAQYLDQRGLRGDALNLKAIITTSEVLSDASRALLNRAFGCPIQNEYGCGEVGPIAYECEDGSLHVSAENLVVEVLKPNGDQCLRGESGEIVVTDLNNLAMPLIRYRLNDFAEVGGLCSCGRGLPTLVRVWGRAYDMIEAADGRRYHGEFFMYLFEDLRMAGMGVDQFQIVQRSASTLEVRIVNGNRLTEAQRDAITARLVAALGPVSVTVSQVPAIERESSGKLRLIVRSPSGS